VSATTRSRAFTFAVASSVAVAVAIAALAAGCGGAGGESGGSSDEGPEPPVCEGEIEVPDEQLRALLLAILADPEASDTDTDTGAPQGLSAEALAGITGLQGAQRGIVDLRGLECASNLRSLGLAGNEITSLARWRRSPSCASSSCPTNPITDLAPLGGTSSSWRSSSLAGSGVAALDVVAGMTGLRHLDVAGGRSRTCGRWRASPTLESLVLSDNAIVELAPLAGLRSLFALELDGNAIVDLTPLAGLTRPRVPRPRRNEITSLAALDRLVHLRDLEASPQPLDRTAGLAGKRSSSSSRSSTNQISALDRLRGAGSP
jgi:Leucine-rich repeat (LRR) protein